MGGTLGTLRIGRSGAWSRRPHSQAADPWDATDRGPAAKQAASRRCSAVTGSDRGSVDPGMHLLPFSGDEAVLDLAGREAEAEQLFSEDQPVLVAEQAGHDAVDTFHDYLRL